MKSNANNGVDRESADVRLRQKLYPYQAILAICSYLDETPDRGVYWEIMQFLTSLEENSPMGVEEAMAASVPVVTSNRCGIPYMVCDGESGFLVDPNNPDDVARRLGQLLKNGELRRSMGAKGREIALDRFCPSKVAARTREVYLRIIHDFHQK